MTEILYRSYGPSFPAASLCPHLKAELDAFLSGAIDGGETLKLTKAEAERCNIRTFMPVDLTEAERFEFAERATKFFFWGRGSNKCRACGHVARGGLAQSTAAEKRKYEAWAAR